MTNSLVRRPHGTMFQPLVSILEPSTLFKSPLSDAFDQMFDEIFRDTSKLKDIAKNKAYYPKTDVYETEDQLVFEMAVPGMKKEDLSVEVDNATITVSGRSDNRGKTVHTLDGVKVQYFQNELKHSEFKRAWSLPVEYLDISESRPVTSKLADGILTISIPLKPKEQPKSTSIKVAIE